MKTLITEHWAGQVRGIGANQPTRVSPVHRLPALGPRALFERAYPAFSDRCRAVDQPGIALVAVDEVSGKAMGMACLRAQVGRPVTAIVGRHDCCDLYVEGNERFALRQLAVVLEPVTDWRPGSSTVSFRVLDLRTTTGMVDEEGRALRGLRSEGPAIVRSGGYVLFALPLGDPSDWPMAPDDAWMLLPERVYHDELVRVPDGSVVHPRFAERGHITVVTRIPGPRELSASLTSGRDVAGRLWLRGPSGTHTLDISTDALRDGVLLGRYDRCDCAGIDLGNSVSRVHALLVLVNDRLLAIDVASTNGTRCVGGPDARVLELDDHTMVELGSSTLVRWSWTS